MVAQLELRRSMTELGQAERALQRAHDEMEARVQQRTAELVQANAALQREMVERKRAEAASVRLAAIVESSGDAIIGKNLESIITSWNKGAELLFGDAAAEMVGTSIMRLLPAGQPDDHQHILARIKRGENVAPFETVRHWPSRSR